MKRVIAVGLLASVCFLSGCFWASPADVNPERRTLEPCPDSPNCVSSLEDDDHAIEPLRYEGSLDVTRGELVGILTNNYSASVENRSDTYVYATVATTLGFVDDVEFLFRPEDQLIHVRSASRVGRSDLGANRERVEYLREQLRRSSP